MELIITGKHIDIDETLKAYAESRFQKLADAYPKLTSARVILTKERNLQVAEAHIYGKHMTLNASEKSKDMAVSIDSVVDKLERQLRKHLERMHEHRAMHLAEAEVAVLEAEEAKHADDDLGEDLEDTPLEAASDA
jgi:putative sigma-54 modulation protein